MPCPTSFWGTSAQCSFLLPIRLVLCSSPKSFLVNSGRCIFRRLCGRLSKSHTMFCLRPNHIQALWLLLQCCVQQSSVRLPSCLSGSRSSLAVFVQRLSRYAMIRLYAATRATDSLKYLCRGCRYGDGREKSSGNRLGVKDSHNCYLF